MINRFLRATFIFLIVGSIIAYGHDELRSFSMTPEDFEKVIDASFQEPFLLTRMSYASDVAFENEEFSYLVDLDEGSMIAPADLKKAIGYLFKKNKFKTIELLIFPEGQGKSLQWNLVGFWTFKRLKFYGYMLNKDAYRRHYLLEQGERFDEEKHAHSLIKIKEAFHEEGYFNNEVQADLIRDETTKTITVHCTLKKGDRYAVNAIRCVFKSDESMETQEVDFMRMQLDQKFLSSLRKNGYSKEKISQQMLNVKKYLASLGFPHCTIELSEFINHEAKSVDLEFSLDLHKKKESIFIGNHHFSNEQLLDVVLLFGASAWMLPASIIQDEIIALYHRHGFWHVHIEAREEQHRHIFLINEGIRIALEQIQLHTVIVDAELLVRRYFSRLIKNNFFQEDDLEKSIEQLLTYYAQRGFLQAKIDKKEFAVSVHDPHLYTLHLFIDEGPCTTITGITIENYPELVHQGPFKRWDQRKNSIPLTMEYIQEQKAWLLEYFRKQHSGFVEVNHEFTYHGSDVEIIWHVTLKNKTINFGKTILLTHSRLPFNTIMRELQYQQGDAWDRTKIRQSLVAFKNLNMFETIQLFPHNAAQEEEEKQLILKLYDDDPFEVRTRIGFGLQQLAQGYKFGGLTYKIGGSFIAKNPCNVADQFCIDADFLRGERNFEVQYMRPWIFDRPIRTLFKGYSNRYLQPGFMGSRKSLYEVVQQGFLVGLTRAYRGITAGVNVGFEVMETSISHDQCTDVFALKVARALNFEPRLLDRKIPYVLFEPTILIDYLDNNVQPTCGSFTVASLKGMFPIGRIQQEVFFVKFLIEQSFFIPCEPWVIALRFRLGHIFYRHFSSIMPSERFYLGGAYSLRSYDTDLCPPLGLFEDCGKCQIVPQGAKTMANINAELRFPVYKNFGAVLFQDLGLLTKNLLTDFSVRGILAGTGFGLRYNTPIGPLRFDMGFKWNSHDPTCRSYAWFLTFGQAF